MPENFEIRAHEDLFFRKDGSTFPVLCAASPVFKDGRPASTVIEIRDVTETRRTQEERERLLDAERAARAEAERANRLKDDFLATVSHELRTPLNAILGYAQLIRRRPLDPDMAEGLEVIERNARVQGQLIGDILDMSRIISGKLRLAAEPVELPRVIDAALDTVRPAANAKGIRLMRVVDPDVGLVVGDAGRLQQVVWNLLTNAVKFTPRDGRVQIVLSRRPRYVQISVSDTGQGIAPEFLPYVFDRFRQADASTTRAHGGLGLGLSIVKNLIEMHGGSVAVDSGGLGNGATFTVLLPLSRQAESSPLEDNAEHGESATLSCDSTTFFDERNCPRGTRRQAG